MPQVGEIKTSEELSKKPEHHKFIWHACVDCGKERWVLLLNGEPKRLRCKSCAAYRRTPSWYGEEYLDRQGYIRAYKPDHPPVYKWSRRVKRAILVLEDKLGRSLLPNMHVHHINGIRTDDRPENLVEVSPSKHTRIHNEERFRGRI